MPEPRVLMMDKPPMKVPAIINKATGRFEDYTLNDMQKLIFFPDITFNGVLPDMTADKFWNILKTEGRDAD